MNLKILWRCLLDALYPPVCVVCGDLSGGSHPHCCPRCLADFKAVGSSCCPRCGRPFPVINPPHPCLSCLIQSRPIVPCRSLYHYRGALARVLSCLKFGKGLCVLDPLVEKMMDAVRNLESFPEVDMLVPVPASKKSLWKRGFNQAAVLAGFLGEGMEVPVERRALCRRGSRSQVGLGRWERGRNARSSFGPGKSIRKVRGKRILLFDDVYTTGATVRACAKVLQRAGASVRILTLARRSSEDFQHLGVDEPV